MYRKENTAAVTRMKMYKLILFLGIYVHFSLSSKLPTPAKDSEKIIGCYYTINLEEDNLEHSLEIGGIDASLCSHLFYSFVGLNSNASLEIFDPYADIESEGYKRFNDIRKKNPQLKTLVSMGDKADEPDREKTNIEFMADPGLRKTLVRNIENFVRKYGFNGIDLRITDSPQKGARPSDKENLVLFLKALKEKFDKKGLILSATVDPNEAVAKLLYDIKGISTYVDFINLRTVDFHEISEAENKVGPPSPIRPSPKENGEERKKNIDYVVKYWISEGAPPSKLILGTAFYGVSYNLANPKQITKGPPFSREDEYLGVFGYDYICSLVKYQGWKHHHDKQQQVPYVYFGNTVIAYDDVESIQKKAEYANKMNLGGAVAWTIDQDDFDGECGEKFPLLKTLNRVLRKNKEFLSIKIKAEYSMKMKLRRAVVWTINADDSYDDCGEKFPLLKTLNRVDVVVPDREHQMELVEVEEMAFLVELNYLLAQVKLEKLVLLFELDDVSVEVKLEVMVVLVQLPDLLVTAGITKEGGALGRFCAASKTGGGSPLDRFCDVGKTGECSAIGRCCAAGKTGGNCALGRDLAAGKSEKDDALGRFCAAGKTGGGNALDRFCTVDKIGGGFAVDRCSAAGKIGGGRTVDRCISAGKTIGGSALRRCISAGKTEGDYALKYWISQTASPNKLMLGIFSYRQSFTLANLKQIGRGTPFSGVELHASSPWTVI
ncbi:chitinase-like protein 4 [Belonocnema kinseyi]|uniref:chitinase-like protein 4 n=1 Tax=Belonocnema kinseyi TaxID=2817044 RepID=UPI00143CFFCA|nr:chitinase-like protein 4 [Belonocnema kinseyi]